MQFCETPSTFELDNVKNETILPDFLIFWPWQHQKRNNSKRLPRVFELDNIKNETILRDFPIFRRWQRQKRNNSARIPIKNGKLRAELTASYQCVLRFFHSTCLDYCACQEKVMPGHTKCCTCHAKSSQQTWRSDAPKCNPCLEISRATS